ncbi:zincin, partial [Colletotrichum falcatum]
MPLSCRGPMSDAYNLSDPLIIVSEKQLRLSNRVIEQVQPDDATFDKVILPLVHVENAVAREGHVLVSHRSVSPNPELHDASKHAQSLLDDFMVERAMDNAMSKLVDAVMRRKEDLDPESLRLLRMKHRDHVRNGLHLASEQERERFAQIKSRLSRLTADFRQTLDEADGGMWLSPGELEGLPENLLSQLENGQGEDEGKLRVSFAPTSFYPTLRFLRRADVRERIYIAGHNNCNQNVPIFRDIIILRDEAARLLGYSSHAAFRLEEKMAKTPETVNAFLDDLRSRLAAAGQRETMALQQLKRRDVESRGESFDGRFFDWDFSYYKRIMLETQYSVDQQKIADYFPLQTTVSGMLSIFQRLFGLVFDENTKRSPGSGQDHVWHEDVRFFSVWDDAAKGSGFVGYLYLDLFARDGKISGAANFNLMPLKALSNHYSSLSPEYLQSWRSQSNHEEPPPRQMPDDMIESLCGSRHVNGALFHLNQLCICIFDMAVHNPESHAAIASMNISSVYNWIKGEIYPPDGPEAV